MYFHEETQAKVEQMAQFAATDRDFDIVFVGNSEIRDAVQPSLFTAFDGREAYNAAVSGASSYIVRRFTLEEVLQYLSPDIVAIGMNYTLLRSDAPRETHDYDKAPMTDESLISELRRRIDSVSCLSRHRESLRDPREVWDAIQRKVDGTAPPSSVDRAARRFGPLGVGLRNRDPEFTEEEEVEERDDGNRRNTKPYEVGGPRAEDIVHLISVLKDRGIRVVLVDLPQSDVRIERLKNGAADYERYRAQLRDLAETINVRLVQGTFNSSDRSLFANENHLNAKGARRFTRFVASEFERLRI